jgi:hypothetical protein
MSKQCTLHYINFTSDGISVTVSSYVLCVEGSDWFHLAYSAFMGWFTDEYGSVSAMSNGKETEVVVATPFQCYVF